MADDTQEGAAHSLLIPETGFGGDRINRVPALLYHQPSRLDPEAFNCFGGRHAGFGPKRSAELARTEPSHKGKLLYRKRRSQILPGMA